MVGAIRNPVPTVRPGTAGPAARPMSSGGVNTQSLVKAATDSFPLSPRPQSSCQVSAKESIFSGPVGDLSTDDAVTTRERLRHQRRDEMREKFEASIAVREQRDTARKVVCNVHHQQLDVAPAPPGQPLVRNLVAGAYYEAKDPVPEIVPVRGLGRRTESSVVRAPSEPRPLTVAEHRRANEEQLARERQLVQAMMTAPRAGTGLAGIRPFPQDDGHDYWGRPLSRSKSSTKGSSNRSTFTLALPDPPPPCGLTNVPPMPGFDMKHPDGEVVPEGWHKPLVMKPEARPVPPEMKDRMTNTDPVLPTSKKQAPPALATTLPRPTSAGVQKVAALEITGQPPTTRPPSAIAPRIEAVQPVTRQVNPALAGAQRFQHRPMDMVSRLF